MMLENLFAHAAQEQAFLAMMAGGLALGAVLQLNGALRRRWRAMGFLWDGLFALLALALALLVMLRFGSGLRAYALLGATLGMLLYHAGISRGISFVGRKIGRLFCKYQKTAGPKEGNGPADGEFNSTNAVDAAETLKMAQAPRRRRGLSRR